MKFTKTPDTCILEILNNRFLSLIILIASTNPSGSYCCYFSLGYNFLLLLQVRCFKFFESLMCVLSIFTPNSFPIHSHFLHYPLNIHSLSCSLTLLPPPPPPFLQDQFVLPSILGCVVFYLESGSLTTVDYTLREISLSLSQQLTFAHRSTAWVELSAQLFFPYWDLVWLRPAWVCIFCYSYCEFMCVAALLCQEDTVYLYSSTGPHTPSNPFFHPFHFDLWFLAGVYALPSLTFFFSLYEWPFSSLLFSAP